MRPTKAKPMATRMLDFKFSGRRRKTAQSFAAKPLVANWSGEERSSPNNARCSSTTVATLNKFSDKAAAASLLTRCASLVALEEMFAKAVSK